MSQNRLEQLLQFLEKEPDDPFLKYGVAMEFLGKGDLSTAIDWLARLRAQHPGYIATYYQLGNALARAGKRDEAVPVLTEGLRLAREQGEKHAARELGQLLEDLVD